MGFSPSLYHIRDSPEFDKYCGFPFTKNATNFLHWSLGFSRFIFTNEKLKLIIGESLDSNILNRAHLAQKFPKMASIFNLLQLPHVLRAIFPSLRIISGNSRGPSRTCVGSGAH